MLEGARFGVGNFRRTLVAKELGENKRRVSIIKENRLAPIEGRYLPVKASP